MMISNGKTPLVSMRCEGYTNMDGIVPILQNIVSLLLGLEEFITMSQFIKNNACIVESGERSGQEHDRIYCNMPHKIAPVPFFVTLNAAQHQKTTFYDYVACYIIHSMLVSMHPAQSGQTVRVCRRQLDR